MYIYIYIYIFIPLGGVGRVACRWPSCHPLATVCHPLADVPAPSQLGSDGPPRGQSPYGSGPPRLRAVMDAGLAFAGRGIKPVGGTGWSHPPRPFGSGGSPRAASAKGRSPLRQRPSTSPRSWCSTSRLGWCAARRDLPFRPALPWPTPLHADGEAGWHQVSAAVRHRQAR